MLSNQIGVFCALPLGGFDRHPLQTRLDTLGGIIGKSAAA
jgi:hypothetical protein